MYTHDTVLLHESVEALDIKPDGIYVDCTFGRGGHSQLILQQLGKEGRLIAFDADDEAIRSAKETFANEQRLTLFHVNFREAARFLNEQGITGVDGVLFDLGVSSPQFDDKSRGFSYQGDDPLDMRMDQRQSLTAREIVNTWSFEDLARILYRYGDEKFSRQIARLIERYRQSKPIETTSELVEIIKEGIPAAKRRTGGHPAKRSFQALRIAVNDEMGAVEESLSAFIPMLRVNGRIAVISFHSLEDRMTKTILDEYCKLPKLPPGLPVIPPELEPSMRWVSKKPIVASEQELEENRRARSAKLRAAEKIK
ncbi:16S rRNA (cytosine(1402)-N(4))-methyltransferase RsmH [Geomicrobium sp. JCM 19039]|uniref:16S rRNA (cytosine(1402)-N(4))-methyltransferase RsmH n=1 Tax=Geomicrobium sp. JCM 19039 TaxID=1460636 RepID=UPI0005A9D3BE|nr:16S rRNA (cytosine(1402)-N(4))-methyltransferase RsmH [Geomicrobium sp. JCM 19039]